jgi:hypothetical protein
MPRILPDSESCAEKRCSFLKKPLHCAMLDGINGLKAPQVSAYCLYGYCQSDIAKSQ